MGSCQFGHLDSPSVHMAIIITSFIPRELAHSVALLGEPPNPSSSMRNLDLPFARVHTHVAQDFF